MSQRFDPYYRWLGIPPKDQPPNHYRLLGIDLFEVDLEVIREAAERQMAHVRTYQLGQHADISQKILNELAAARRCLLNAKEKKAYDEALRTKLSIGGSKERQPDAALPPTFDNNHNQVNTSTVPKIPSVSSALPPAAQSDRMENASSPLRQQGRQVKQEPKKPPLVDKSNLTGEDEPFELGITNFDSLNLLEPQPARTLRKQKPANNFGGTLFRSLTGVQVGVFVGAGLAIVSSVLFFAFSSSESRKTSLNNSSMGNKSTHSDLKKATQSSVPPSPPELNPIPPKQPVANDIAPLPKKQEQKGEKKVGKSPAKSSEGENYEQNDSSAISPPQGANIPNDSETPDSNEVDQSPPEIPLPGEFEDSDRAWVFQEFLANNSVRIVDKDGNAKTVSYNSLKLADQEYIASRITASLMQDCSQTLSKEELVYKYDNKPFLFEFIVGNISDNFFNQYPDNLIRELRSNKLNIPNIPKVKIDLMAEEASLSAYYLILSKKDAAIVKKDNSIMIKGVLGCAQITSVSNMASSGYEIREGSVIPLPQDFSLASQKNEPYSPPQSKMNKTINRYFIQLNKIKVALKYDKYSKPLAVNNPSKDVQEYIRKQMLAVQSNLKRQAAQGRINGRRESTQESMIMKKKLMDAPR